MGLTLTVLLGCKNSYAKTHIKLRLVIFDLKGECREIYILFKDSTVHLYSTRAPMNKQKKVSQNILISRIFKFALYQFIS